MAHHQHANASEDRLRRPLLLRNWQPAVAAPQRASNVDNSPLAPVQSATAGTAGTAGAPGSPSGPAGPASALADPGESSQDRISLQFATYPDDWPHHATPVNSNPISSFERDPQAGGYTSPYDRSPSSPSSSDSSEVDHRGLAWCYGVQWEATFLLPRPTNEEYDFLGLDLISEIPLPFSTEEEEIFLEQELQEDSEEDSAGGCIDSPGAPHSVLLHYCSPYDVGAFFSTNYDSYPTPTSPTNFQGPHQPLEFRKLCVEHVIHSSKWSVRLAFLSRNIMSVILCTAGYDHTIRFWEALSGICSRTIQHSDSQVNRLCISPDKRFLAAAGRTDVKLYDIKSTNPNPVLTFEGHKGNVTGVGFHCEGKWMVTCSEDGTVKIWDTRAGSEQRNYDHGKDCGVNDVVIHPNQGELISCDQGGNVRIWDLGENKCTHQLIPEDEVPVRSVSVASDGSMLIAGNNRGNIFVWRMIQNRDVTSLVPITKFQAHHKYITRVLLSPDVRHLATCSADHTAKIWAVDPTAMTAMTNAAAAGPPITNTTAVTDSTGGNTMVHTANSSAMSSPPNAFPLEATLHQHQRWVWDCAFSADSAYLVTACSDHYARLWELSSQQIIRQYNGHHRGAVCVALNDYSER